MRPFLTATGLKAAVASRPAAVDLSADFPAVVDQGPLASCTAATTAALVSYFQRRAHGRVSTPSLLFLYKVTRNILGLQGDTGALLRSTMQALRLFGTLPDRLWPYDARALDFEPTPFHYQYASNYRAKAYYRLDEPGLDRRELLVRVQAGLATGLPAMFGLFTFPSLALAFESGSIAVPERGEMPQLTHALVAVGYDEQRAVRHPLSGRSTTGALRVRNSWGGQWGESGYGWLPFDYVLNGYTSDWWSLVEADFVDTGQFGQR